MLVDVDVDINININSELFWGWAAVAGAVPLFVPGSDPESPGSASARLRLRRFGGDLPSAPIVELDIFMFFLLPSTLPLSHTLTEMAQAVRAPDCPWRDVTRLVLEVAPCR